MKYTQAGEEVDRFIQGQLDIVVEEIRRGIPGAISIILYGGFGRGEGTVKRLKKAGLIDLRALIGIRLGNNYFLPVLLFR